LFSAAARANTRWSPASLSIATSATSWLRRGTPESLDSPASRPSIQPIPTRRSRLRIVSRST
jgi:hypothetical protein